MSPADIDSSPPPLPKELCFVVALAAVCASQRRPTGTEWAGADTWLDALLALLDLERDALPPDVDPEIVAATASERDNWSHGEKRAIAWKLIHAALAPQSPNPGDKDKAGKDAAQQQPRITYSAVARAAAHRTLALIGLDSELLPRAEAEVGANLAAALEGDKAAVEAAVSKQRQGWGGALGRRIATGAGVIAGGVIVGVTGGLAAPAIAAMLGSIGMGGAILSATAAPFVIGGLLGVTGGGLTGWRVSERYRGIDNMQFIEVGAGTRPTKQEAADLKKHEPIFDIDYETRVQTDDAARREVERTRYELEGRLQQLSLNAHTDVPGPSPPTTPLEEGEFRKETAPSLTGTVVVPGLLTVSQTEGMSAWRAACSPFGHPSASPGSVTPDYRPTGLKDGRDVYLMQYETEMMLTTGRDIQNWVADKITSTAATQVIKHTALAAYYAAIALPLSVYKLSTMALDNSWVGAQDKATKAGRLLGEVLAQHVQGERPVVLIGTSVGALTVLHALLYLSTLDGPPIVDSVFFVSLPSAPTAAEWAAVRRSVARRVVNAWTGSDMVLAGVVRLHEVVSRGVTGNSGIKVAGLGPVMGPGIEDVDLSDVLGGHSEINANIAEILDVLQVDD